MLCKLFREGSDLQLQKRSLLIWKETDGSIMTCRPALQLFLRRLALFHSSRWRPVLEAHRTQDREEDAPQAQKLGHARR